MQAKTLLLAGGALLGAAPAAWASGFQVNLAGQRNIGMGGVGVGLSLDQAAMFYNPGALAMVKGNGVQIGANLAMPKVAFRSASSGEQTYTKDQNVTPANFYAGFGPESGKFKIGIAAYTPFGSELHYADNWAGHTALTDINLRSIFGQLTGSYAISDKLSIGAGLVVLAYGDVNLQKDATAQLQTDPSNPEKNTPTHVTLSGKAKQSFGYNVGIFFKPTDKFSVGASYRSKLDAKVEDGTVSVRNVGSLGTQLTATSFSTTLPLPATASLGFGFKPNEKLTIGLDANYVFWSTYETLQFDFSGNNGYGDRYVASTNTVVPGTSNLGGSSTSISQRQYKDALTLRLGGQYMVTTGLALRLGGFYDFTAVKDGFVTPETPDADRIGLSAGVGYTFADAFTIDLSFLAENFRERTQTQQQLATSGITGSSLGNDRDRVAGTYKTVILIPGVGLSYKF